MSDGGELKPTGPPPESPKAPETPALSPEMAVFNWTKERRKKVVDESKNTLRSFLSGQGIDSGIVDKIAGGEGKRGLYENIIRCFREGADLQAGSWQKKFLKNELAAHTDYHIAKFTDLIVKLYQTHKVHKALSVAESVYSQENALALVVSAALHDLGQLEEDTGKEARLPQERFYADHEMRAINMVDGIVDGFDLQYEGYDANRLKAKVKLLIASTNTKLNMYWQEGVTGVDNLPIIKYLESGGEGHLKEVSPDLAKTVKEIKQDFLNQGVFSIGECKFMLGLTCASDHGAYALEPSIAEVVSLYKELQNMWLDDEQKICFSETLTPESSLKFSTGNYTRQQFTIYGNILALLGENPFLAGQSIEKRKDWAKEQKSRLEKKAPHDPLLRFEGFFSPRQLNELINKLIETETPQTDEYLSLKNTLVGFAQRFASSFRKPSDFSPLCTDVLKIIYDKCSVKAQFFKEALGIMSGQMKSELEVGGKYDLHLAPFAYLGDTKDVIQVQELLRDVLAGKNDQIGKIYLTLREDKGDDVELLLNALQGFSGTEREPFGIALGGHPMTQDYHWFSGALEGLKEENNACLPVTVHIGLESQEKEISNRLNHLFLVFGKMPEEDLKRKVRIHVDDRFGWFANYYKTPQAADKRTFLKTVLQSSSPLAYLLSAGEEEEYQRRWQDLKDYYNLFPGSEPASNNCVSVGDFSIAVQAFCRNLLKLNSLSTPRVI